MKFITDLLPVIFFFIAYQIYDIYVATAVAIVTGLIQVVYSHFKHGKAEKMQWITLGLLLLFGGLTLLLRDPTFIKWKPTIVNWLFAGAFYFSGYLMDRNLLQKMMDHAVTMPEQAWQRLNLIWVGFFIFSGALNLYVAFNFSEETWVNFKLFGLMGLTLAFVIGQGFYIARYMTEEATTAEEQ